MADDTTILSGWESVQGRRNTMEDSLIEMDDFKVHFNLESISEPIGFWAVFDGHGGKEAAMYLAANFAEKLAHHPNFGKMDKIPDILTETFKTIDDELIALARSEGWMNGSTAAVCLRIGRRIWFANIGDSEILAGFKSGNFEILSEIHHPDQPEEEKRIKACGGQVRKGRIQGNVILSRAFGDWEYKHPFNETKGGTGDFISTVPHIEEKNLDDLAFVVMASDGLWDMITKPKAHELCVSSFKSKITPTEISESLVKAALNANSRDNTTVVTLKFGN
eukprot:CAMPEP_0201481012 /NCGR_PEP_ID=MMETSP0151_2-20130828/5353_1 /ASSEMBLY_ACC=CAM_ASM_000257 /TAXON_ID=200890 /ORGANISM="Paramoeba atlantica, Strain 621/1 / CCAP 1560/9" /LENGTH=277 /DNA_ID=CAMNT_0047863025 /DNA_START=52 /DNA_END=885 /DNA_ORIENTATION=-